MFAEEILGVRLNRAQKRWLRYAAATRKGWQWVFKRTIHVAANQIGKTLGLAILILWACIYKIGIDRADPEWLQRPYLSIHLAPVQQQAYHPLNDARLLIKGAHPAQVSDFRMPKGMVSEAKVATYYDGLEFASGAVAQFRTSEQKAAAIQGYRANFISFDEAAFEDHLNSVVNETLMMRLISTGGPLHIVSTPNGMNDYFDLVEEVRRLEDQPEDMVWIDRSRMHAVCWSVITDNVGYGITQSEVDRMEEAIDPATKEQQLRGAFLEPAEAFFTPQDKILAAFGSGRSEVARKASKLPNEQEPMPGHRYVIFWDVSVSSDPTAVFVIDVTRRPWTGVYFRHYLKPLGTVELVNAITSLHNLYHGRQDPSGMLPPSRAITGYDSTSLGGKIMRDLLRDVRPSRGLDFGGPSKKVKTLSELKAMLSKGDLLIPPTWTRARQEVLSYRLDDKKLRQDCVMALDGAVEIATSSMNIGVSMPFDMHTRVSR